MEKRVNVSGVEMRCMHSIDVRWHLRSLEVGIQIDLEVHQTRKSHEAPNK